MYQPAIDLDAITALDMHTHVHASVREENPEQSPALAIAVHKPQVYLELSGWSPKYFPPQLVHYANTMLRDRVLFGSDFPLITPDRWLADAQQAGFRDEVMPGLLKGNAARLLGLRSASAESSVEGGPRG